MLLDAGVELVSDLESLSTELADTGGIIMARLGTKQLVLDGARLIGDDAEWSHQRL